MSIYLFSIREILDDNMGNIVAAYLSRKQNYRPIDLAECEREATENTWGNLRFQTASNKVLNPPDGTWPNSLLEFYHHGCGNLSSLDLQTGRIFFGGNPFLLYEANSLEEWLERWLQEENVVPASSGRYFLPEWLV